MRCHAAMRDFSKKNKYERKPFKVNIKGNKSDESIVASYMEQN